MNVIFRKPQKATKPPTYYAGSITKFILDRRIKDIEEGKAISSKELKKRLFNKDR